MVQPVHVLAGLGVALSIPYLLRLISFVWLYYLRPSSIQSYLHGPAPYAIVTGATDGIGKATAAELLKKGFNLILHGRNDKKMEKVVEELRAQVKGRANADIRYFLADASKSGQDFAKLVEPFKDLDITYVFHNVGGSDTRPERIDGRTEEYLLGMVYKNALFPLFLTRALLPQLRRTSKGGPVLVQFVGSIAGDISPPSIAIYAASKGFLESLVRGLDNDETSSLDGAGPSSVRFTYLSVGSVHSDNHDAPMTTSWTTPTCEAFAEQVVRRSGCGRRRVTPYTSHAIVQWVVGLLKESTVDDLLAQEMKLLIAQAAKGK